MANVSRYIALEGIDGSGKSTVASALAALDEAFVDDYCGIGGHGAVRAKIAEYRDAGVTLPAVSPLPRHDGSRGVEETIRAAAPA